jgi:hypothetical protein
MEFSNKDFYFRPNREQVRKNATLGPLAGIRRFTTGLIWTVAQLVRALHRNRSFDSCCSVIPKIVYINKSLFGNSINKYPISIQFFPLNILREILHKMPKNLHYFTLHYNCK